MQRTAICACGQASLAVSGPPEMHGVCHCENCKRRTGSAFGVSTYFLKSSVTAQEGATTIYAFQSSGEDTRQERHFCSVCGTTLFWYISSLPQLIGVAGGCLAGSGLQAPVYSANHASKETWVALPSSCRAIDDEASV
ncbi:GFA family protein [Polaromonas sp.]|uniref:GFA family protein n=1 Tax=Polaromonas sp. TaxID=1869339 RepID=UPI003FA7516C